MRTLALSIGLVLLVPACSKGFGSGFEGEITMHTQRPGEKGNDMSVKAKGDKLRFDVPSATGNSAGIFDPTAGKVTMLIESQKSYMDLDFNKPSAQPNTNPSTATAEKTGKKDNVAGIDCEEWIAKDASGKHSEVCFAPGIAFFDLQAAKGGGGGGGSFAKEMRDNKLFPLRSVEFDEKGAEISRMEVTKVEKKKLDDSLFQVPADYKKIELPAMLKK